MSSRAQLGSNGLLRGEFSPESKVIFFFSMTKPSRLIVTIASPAMLMEAIPFVPPRLSAATSSGTALRNLKYEGAAMPARVMVHEPGVVVFLEHHGATVVMEPGIAMEMETAPVLLPTILGAIG